MMETKYCSSNMKSSLFNRNAAVFLNFQTNNDDVNAHVFKSSLINWQEVVHTWKRALSNCVMPLVKHSVIFPKDSQ